MKRKGFLCIVLMLFIQFGFAQNKLQWQGYFSFNKIKDITQSATNITAAAENAILSKNINTNKINTKTTIDGLSGESISAIYHSSLTNKTIVGYENGLLAVINEKDGSTLKIVDIINQQISSNQKKINHFFEYQGFVYISCDFGIVQFNLSTLLFGETYFIGVNGTALSVLQTTIFNGFIYAATRDGILKADITNKYLVDFSQWTKINNGSWSSIETFDKELVAINTTGLVYKYNSFNSFSEFIQLPQPSVDMRVSEDYLLITTPLSVFVYDKQMTLVNQINSTQILETNLSFTCSTSLKDKLYIGTNENGLYSATISVVSDFENIIISSPIQNNIFAIQTTSTSLWAVYGDYSVTYNPYPLDSYGISKYEKSGWLNIPYNKVLGAQSLCRITVNPNKENEVYISSFFSGLLKLENDTPKILYNQTNSKLESLVLSTPNPSYIDIRINGAAFDRSESLWITNSLVKDGLKTLNPNGQWKSYSMKDILSGSSSLDGIRSITHFGRLFIDSNGTKWISTNNEGLIGFNEKNNAFKKITLGAEKGNLPSSDVRVSVSDKNNQLWIGTNKGLRVLNNIDSFNSENQMIAESIIILDDGLAQELLFEQFITDIVVDGANNKWIGTVDSGVFLISPNGQQTKYHFTINNSPLPSNTINDIDINSLTGEVFIATNKGMVSFKGVSTGAKENLNEVFVYPNPVRPEFTGTVKISGLLDKATIKITDIEGNLVYETTSEGGTIEWDTTAFGKQRVASGVYMIFISAEDGMETKVKKVMIIR